MEAPEIINGGSNTDARGTVSFVNNFRMDKVKRFYIIKHPDTKIVRAWRAHKAEQCWFYIFKGSFKIKAIKIDNWETPSKSLQQISFTLEQKKNQVLHIPKGYATSLQSLEKDSELIVFADSSFADAKNDDFLYPADYFEE